MLTAHVDGIANLWSCVSREFLRSLEGHGGEVTSVAFSPDGELVVTALDDGTAKVWDIVSGECLRSLEGHSSEVVSVAISPV